MLIHLRKIDHAFKLIERYQLNIITNNKIVSPLVIACSAEGITLDFVEKMIARMVALDDKVIGAAVQASIVNNRDDLLDYFLSSQPVNLNRCYHVKSALGPSNQLPLQTAIQMANLNMVGKLLEAGASPRIIYSKHAKNMVAYAKQVMSTSVVELYGLRNPLAHQLFGIQQTTEEQTEKMKRYLVAKIETLKGVVERLKGEQYSYLGRAILE